MGIIVLPESSYLTSHEMVTEGQMGVTRKASIEWDDGTIRKCYVKVYPSINRIMKICNELTGFLLAKTLGLKQPDSAALIPLNKIYYSDYLPAIDINNTETVWAWITTECGSSIKGVFQLNNIEELYEQDPIGTQQKIAHAFNLICDQKNLPELIAFDDFIANNDRNIGNLVMVGDGEMGIIDHGEILGRIDWIKNLPSLDKKQIFNNHLLNILDGQATSSKDFSKFNLKHKAVESKNHHKNCFITTQELLITWWGNLLEVSNIPINEHQKYIDTLHEFLHYRSHQSSIIFANRIGLVA
ncbi:hypothetical protein OZX61_07480 [Acinetobacter sp. ESL0695]|uniref:hypothetical protein n=1 Tax=Acinetobacter sp. ESL0695 TaxID=2983215 RepID=UPI0023F36C1F|nr:hypothetical protein [Acinetobacter sp. ESL0695]WEV48131.1 hypothetical protein OZX61_07480 [Acinetobacter sp. ESL0695]